MMTSSLNPTLKWIARVVLALITFVWYSPSVYATVQQLTKPPALNRIENYYPLGAVLEQLRHELLARRQALDVLVSQPSKVTTAPTALPPFVITYREQIETLEEALRDQLHANLAHLQNKQQSDSVIARQTHIIADYEQRMATLYTLLDQLTAAENGQPAKQQQALLDQALAQLNTPFARPHESYSNDLDFLAAPARAIYSSQSQINTLLGTDGGQYTAADSATQATPAITEKVAALGTNPLTLYQWVHDTIRWVPSYGVMQGADYTLHAEQGNAFDTASLLISLLRAAGHEARYRYGIVHAPVNQMRNWIGNVKNADAVANLLSQGGIPQMQITYGGAIEEIRFEHVWVEVKDGTAWRALDPSFKQYAYTDGMALDAAVNFDAQGLLYQLTATSTHNDAEGWVQGVDATLIQTQLTNYQNQLETYLTNNAPDATLGEVLGMQTIVPETATTLTAAAPTYAIQLSAAKDQLPNALFHRFRYQVGTSVSYDLGNSYSWGSELFALDKLTTELVGKDLAFSFRPATAADEAAIASYLPEVINSVEDLPNSLPAGSIQMVGELTIDGVVVQATPPITLGESLKTRLGFVAPQTAYKYTENNIVAGQYQAIGLDMQGLSPTQLEDLQAKLENTQTQLTANNTASLTKHDVVGSILQAGVQGYLAMTYATDRIAAQAAGVVYHRQPSYGTFSTDMQVSYLIGGTPHHVTFTGVAMDIDRLLSNVEEKQNCYDGWLAFNRASGMRSSAYEHQIPEQLFSTETEQAEGVSTAKALAMAMAQGQRVYTLTSANASQLNFITIDAGARAEIQSALSQGLEVTVHQNPISVNGWTGSGYSIINPEYGVGAYKISGGASGGFLDAPGAISLLTGFLGLLLGIAEYDSVSHAMKVLVQGIATSLTGFATILSLIFGIADILMSCSGVSLPLLMFMLTVSIFLTVFLTFFTVFTGTVGAFLLNSIVGSFLTILSDWALRTLKTDAGCN